MKYKYHILMDYKMDDIENKVTKWMNTGWRPVGGIAIDTEDWGNGNIKTVFYQAMICEEPQSK